MITLGSRTGRGALRLGLLLLLSWVAAHSVEAVSPQEDLVFFTDDTSARGFGCDTVSVYDIGGEDPVEIERPKIVRSSPARLTARADMSLIIAQNSNDVGMRLDAGNPLGGHLHFLWDLGRDVWPRWKHELVTADVRLSQLGAPLLLPDGDTLLSPVEIAGPVRNGPTVPMLVRFSIAEIRNGKLGPIHGELRLGGLVVGQFMGRRESQVHLLTTEPKIHTIDAVTMQEMAAPILLPTFTSDTEETALRFPERFMHGVLTTDRRFLLGNLGFSGKMFVADLETRKAWDLPVVGSRYVGGLDISRGSANTDLLALHLGDAVAVYSFEPSGRLIELARRPVNTEWLNYTTGWRNPIHGGYDLAGPATSIAWASQGRKLVAAHDVDQSDPSGPQPSSTFRVFDVAADGRNLRPAGDLLGCSQYETIPNDILTYNSHFPLQPTAPPLSTASEPTQPSPEPSASPTATATVTTTPTDTATATASMTPIPFRAYLPLTLREPICKPDPRPVDAVLVLDASSSMEGAKLAAAQSAARAFLAVLDLRTDRMGLVSFNSVGAILSPLNADSTALITAIDAIQTSPGTRMDRGLAAAQSMLAAASGRPAAAALVVLLTDGRQDEQPDLALEAAARLRAGSVRLEAIGYGADADLDFLIALTTDQDRVHRAADEASLVALYRMLAAADCAQELGWSGR